MKSDQLYDMIILEVVNKRLKNKIKSIEDYRNKLYKIIDNEKNLSDDKILSLSRELDEEIVNYYKLHYKRLK
jgi:adenine/guanine phosphoribosyltransferase-like PRPP-binding protein